MTVAEDPAGDGLGEDRWLFHEADGQVAWAAVIDGASSSSTESPTGGDYADALRDSMISVLTTSQLADPSLVLRSAIRGAVHRLALPKNSAPSAAVGLVRWSDDGIDAATLGDVSVAVLVDGSETLLRDSRLGSVDRQTREQYKASLRAGLGYGSSHTELMHRLRRSEMSARNTDGGYWIAADAPDAALHALTLHAPSDSPAVVLASDGGAAAVNKYGLLSDWRELVQLVRSDPKDFVRRIRTAEASDRDGRRWPRSKPSDDIAVLVLSRV